MRKPTFCICENKDADQLRGNREADQCLCFRYLASTIPLLPLIQNFKSLAISSSCTAWFVSDLVQIHIVGFLMTQLKYSLLYKLNLEKYQIFRLLMLLSVYLPGPNIFSIVCISLPELMCIFPEPSRPPVPRDRD